MSQRLWGPSVPTLYGDGFVLDAFRPIDLEPLIAAMQHPAAAAALEIPPRYDRAHALAFAECRAAGGAASGAEAVFVLRRESDAPYLGHLTAGFVDGARTAKIGIAIAPAAQGAGLGRASAALLIDWCFSVGVDRVRWESLATNRRSMRLAKSLGLRFVGEGISSSAEFHRGACAVFGELAAAEHRGPKLGWPTTPYA